MASSNQNGDSEMRLFQFNIVSPEVSAKIDIASNDIVEATKIFAAEQCDNGYDDGDRLFDFDLLREFITAIIDGNFDEMDTDLTESQIVSADFC